MFAFYRTARVIKQHTHPCVLLALCTCLLFSVPLSTLAGMAKLPVLVQSPPLHATSIYENYNIPSINNRHQGASDNTRLWIKEIRLQGLNDFPAWGIHALEVQAFVEKLRFNLMRESEIQEYGHSQKEIAEIAQLLNKVDAEHRYEHATTSDLQRFIWLVRRQKEQRGLSMDEVEGIAEKVQHYYHRRGLHLAKAYVSRQPMREGLVTIDISLALLGSTRVLGNQLYNNDIITRVFDDMLGGPATSEQINTRSYLLNDYPGLRINGNVDKGHQVGDTQLTLSVINESAFDTTLRLDNHGSEQTGAIRAFAEFNWNNPGGMADQINLAILQSTSPDNTTYGRLGYRLPLFNPRWHLSLAASSNQFILDQTQEATGIVNQLGLTGNTEQLNIDIRYTYRRSREKSIWFSLASDAARTQLDSDDLGDLDLGDQINNQRVSMQFDLLNSVDKRLHIGSITLTRGAFIEGARRRDQNYTKLKADYTLMSFIPLTVFNTTARVLFKSELQYSDNALPSIEQNAMASPTKVRAYPINQFSTDTSFYVGFEWALNTPEVFMFNGLRAQGIAQKMQPLFFLNAATGIQNSTTAAEPARGTLMDAGVGLQYEFGRNINGNLQIAFPLRDQFNTDITVPSDTFKIVFDFQYRI